MEQRDVLIARLRATAEELAALEQLIGAEEARLAHREALREEYEDILDRLHPEQAVPPPPPSDALAPEGLAIVVGHTRQSQGAGALSPPFPASTTDAGVSARHEYAWNTDLARMIRKRAELARIRCEIFFRDGVGIAGAYENVRRWSPKATVELHFNAGGGNARGSLVLYGRAESKPWAEALQKRIVTLYNRQGRSEDRGVFIPGPQRGYERGLASVTQLHPSALIEPFFGDSQSDAMLGLQKKQGLADAILAAFASFAGLPAPGPGAVQDQPQDVIAPDRPAADAGIPDVPLLRDLIATYRGFTPPVGQLAPEIVERLKSITLAQWIEESGWARSELASRHSNFAGMKAISEVDAIIRDAPARRVEYLAHDGLDTYLAFGGIRDFIRGYFMFLDRSPYRGWREMAARSPHDFIRFIGRKWAQRDGYASRVIAIERRLVDAGIARADGTLAAGSSGVTGGIAPVQGGDGAIIGGVDMAAVGAQGATPGFLSLVAALGSGPLPALLQPVLVAQWGLESDWGRSDLARIHENYAGIPWSDLYRELAAPVPHPGDPARGIFCRFLSASGFLRAYRHRLDNDPAFVGWTAETAQSARFAGFLGRTWRPIDPDYAQKIISIAQRIAPAGGRTTPPASQGGGASGPGVAADVVLRVTRLRAERRRGKGERTASSYQLFADGRPVEGISGMFLESRGPGDNSSDGVRLQTRIRAGTYPLSTHSGASGADGVTKYKTIGFTDDGGVGVRPRPSIRLDGTRSRSGILFHPGDGYLWSIGCLNPSRPLTDANGNMEYADSRTRVIALIEAIREAIGDRFPRRNNQPIPGASIEIIGEPGPAGTDALAVEREITPEAHLRQELAVAEAALASAGGDALGGPDHVALHDMLAARMRAAAMLGEPLGDAFQRVSVQGIVLSDLLGPSGETLWTPWSQAVSAASAADSSSAVDELAVAAGDLHAAGVPIDDGTGTHSALVMAAASNDVDAIEALLAQGASVDFADRSGMTPLLSAAFHGAPEVVARLLERGADPRAVVGTVDESLIFDEAELAAPGDDAMACALAGAALASDDAARVEDYERVTALLWNVLNPL